MRRDVVTDSVALRLSLLQHYALCDAQRLESFTKAACAFGNGGEHGGEIARNFVHGRTLLRNCPAFGCDALIDRLDQLLRPFDLRQRSPDRGVNLAGLDGHSAGGFLGLIGQCLDLDGRVERKQLGFS